MIQGKNIEVGFFAKFMLLAVVLGLVFLTANWVTASVEQISVLRNADFSSTSYWTNNRFFTVADNKLHFDVGDRTGKRWLQQDIIDTLVDQRHYTFTTDIELSTTSQVVLRVVHNHGTVFYDQALPAGRHQIEASQYISWKQEFLEKARLQVLVYDETTNKTTPYTIHAIDLTYQTPLDLLSGLENLMTVTTDSVSIDGHLQVESLAIGQHQFVLDEDGNLCIGNCTNPGTSTATATVSVEEEEEITENISNSTTSVTTETTGTTTEETTSTTSEAVVEEEEIATSTEETVEETATSSQEITTATSTAEEIASSTTEISTSTATSTNVN